MLIVTFGTGVPMSLRVAEDLSAAGGPRATVFDLRWMTPLPVNHLTHLAAQFEHVLVADETRRAGGVGEAVVAELVASGYGGHIHRISSSDSFIPLGPSSEAVLLSEDDIRAALKWCIVADRGPA